MQHDLFAAPDTSSGKTSQAPFPQTVDEILLSWLGLSLGASSTYQLVGGEMPELLSERTGSSNGACWMRSSSEWRSGAVVCSLSSILETGPVEARYFLSQRACSGILRRAENRGKNLPPQLLQALQQVAGV